MKQPKKIELGPRKYIIAVSPEYASGPGWSNAPTWVYIVGDDDKLRHVCIQPDERTPELQYVV